MLPVKLRKETETRLYERDRLIDPCFPLAGFRIAGRIYPTQYAIVREPVWRFRSVVLPVSIDIFRSSSCEVVAARRHSPCVPRECVLSENNLDPMILGSFFRWNDEIRNGSSTYFPLLRNMAA
jgi:hypothetical protein